jgi:cell division cycle 14
MLPIGGDDASLLLLPDKNATFVPVLTYVQDRLYLAAYIQPPTADTVFPYPETPISPRKRGAVTQAPTASSRKTPCYFSVDDTLLYNAFHHDFGPLHIGHLYRFAIQFHDILGAKENKDRPIVFWSYADPRSRCLVPSPLTTGSEAALSNC